MFNGVLDYTAEEENPDDYDPDEELRGIPGSNSMNVNTKH